jgi:hypothetical protein
MICSYMCMLVCEFATLYYVNMYMANMCVCVFGNGAEYVL